MVEEDRIARNVVDSSYWIHRDLGPGLLESVYEHLLARELGVRGHEVERQVLMPLSYRGETFEKGFRADIVVDRQVILELKAVEHLKPVHTRQLLSYLRGSGMRLGLLLNFGETLMKDGIVRVANNLPEPHPPPP